MLTGYIAPDQRFVTCPNLKLTSWQLVATADFSDFAVAFPIDCRYKHMYTYW